MTEPQQEAVPTEQPEVTEPTNGEAPPVQGAPEQEPKQTTYRAALVPQSVMQQIVDLLRDEPIPRKKTDGIMRNIERIQYVDVPLGPIK